MQSRQYLTLATVGAIALFASIRIEGQRGGLPRTYDGHPDLTGMYDLAMLTPLERPAGLPAVMSDEEAAKLEKRAADQNRVLDRNIDGNRSAPPKGGDGSVGPAGNVGGYNNFWLDRGSEYNTV